MKKIIAILMILVNMLLFFSTREVYLQKDFADMVQLHEIHPDARHVTLMIENIDDDGISDQIFDKFEMLTTQFNLHILTNESERMNDYHWYVASHTPIDELFHLITDQSLNFNEQMGRFYTNGAYLEGGVNFFLLNNRMNVRISPMRSMGLIRERQYTFVAMSQADLDASVSRFMAEFGGHVLQQIEWISEPFVIEAEMNTFLPTTIVTSMILLFLMIIMYIHMESKKIAIYKIMGLSFLSLAKEMFLPVFAVISFSIFTTHLALFVSMIGSINDRTVPFILMLIYIFIWQLFGVVITFATGSLLMRLIPTYAMLKNSNFNRYLMGANYVMKIIVLVVMLPGISYRIDLLQHETQILKHVHHYRQNAQIDTYQFSPRLLPRYAGDGYLTLIRELSVAYFIDPDPTIIENHHLLYDYHWAYQILNEAGAIFSDYAMFFTGEHVLNVNENYIRKHDIIDSNGNVIQLGQITSDRVYLIPEMYLEREFVNDIINDGATVMPIQNQQTLYDYGLTWQWQQITKDPIVVSVIMDHAFVLWSSPLQHVFLDGDFNEILQDTPFYNRMVISTVKEELAQIQNRHITALIDHLFVMLPSLVLLLIIIIQYAYLYVKVYRKRLIANQMMGHNPWRNFSQLLIESVLAILASLSVAWYLNLDIRLLLIVVLFDLAIYVKTVGWFLKNVHHDG